MACGECDQEGVDQGLYGYTSCIDGEEYTACEDENCGGVCEPIGPCSCWCHRVKHLFTASE